MVLKFATEDEAALWWNTINLVGRQSNEFAGDTDQIKKRQQQKEEVSHIPTTLLYLFCIL